MTSAAPAKRSALAEDLAREAQELRQTHISWVFMHEDRVFKVKKPVSLGFLDFSTLALRRQACEAELRLNRRLAPDVYLGLRPIVRDAQGRHGIGAATGAHAEAVDWAVEMRRLPDAHAAQQRLAAGTLSGDDVERVATALSDFHAALPVTAETSAFGTATAVRGNVEENFEQSRECVPDILSRSELSALHAAQLDFLDRHDTTIDARAAQGRCREGHGDLRLEHVYLDDDGRVEVIDCVEFSARLRCADVCSDLAFLAMDLRLQGHDRLAEWLLSSYALHANDYGLYAISDFYESYRAHVRAKVTGITARDTGRDPAARARAGQRSKTFFTLAADCMRGAHGRPLVIAVGGVIASGKSTLARALSMALGLPRIEADRTRKHLAGVPAEQKLGGAAFSGAYAPDASARTYAEVRDRAQQVLRSGRAVVIDASFRSRDERDALGRLADAHGAALLMVECRAPLQVCRARLAERARGAHVSDGRLEVLDAFADSYEPIDELSAHRHLPLDTTVPVEHNIALALQKIAALRG